MRLQIGRYWFTYRRIDRMDTVAQITFMRLSLLELIALNFEEKLYKFILDEIQKWQRERRSLFSNEIYEEYLALRA